MSKPKIYCFSNVKGGGDGIAYAMAEDGTVLGSHWCSHEGFVSGDLGVTRESNIRPSYAEHYPDGYEMEFVPSDSIKTHKGLMRAWELNRQMKVEDDE